MTKILMSSQKNEEMMAKKIQKQQGKSFPMDVCCQKTIPPSNKLGAPRNIRA
jgi:hypothetical protein